MPLIKPDGQVIQTSAAIQTSHKSTGRVLSNWLMSYLEYTSENEAPEIFHTWVGLATIAGAAQRKVFMETQFFPVHTNMFIILVGPPGSKKTTAIRQGKKMLRKVPGVNFTTTATSVTALIKQFTAITAKDHQSLTAYSNELSSLLGISRHEMIEFLTDIYDCEPDWDKQTHLHGKEKIPYPWLNVIAATTPQWMGDNLSRTAVEGGFVSRSIFPYSSEIILKSPFTKRTEAYMRLEEKLVNDLAHISVQYGEFEWEEAALEWYNEWYLDKTRFPTLTDNRLQGYYMRKHVHLLKVAIALTLAERDTKLLDLRSVKTALAMLEQVEPDMKRAFSAVGGNVTMSDMERIAAQVKASGELTYGDILAHNLFSVSRQVIDELLTNLVDMGEIKRIVVPGEGTVYRGL